MRWHVKNVSYPGFSGFTFFESPMSSAGKPKTTAGILCVQIQALISGTGSYLARDNFEARKLSKDCERLEGVDPFDGALARMFMAEAFGDVDEAKRLGRQARALSPEH